MKSLIFSVLLFFFSLNSFAGSPPLAIVYRGTGACKLCATGAAKAALSAGLRVQYVTENIQDLHFLSEAKVWIQPGGVSGDAIKAMGPAYLEQIRQFVFNGGGYVGFCAGAFLAAGKNSSDLEGLGIVPGKARLVFKDGPDAHSYLVDMTWWNNEKRVVYFNGGGYFDLTGVNDPNLQVIATYDHFHHSHLDPTPPVAGIFTLYGQGRVAVVGSHPEHLGFLKLIHFKLDPDGSDRFLAVKMIQKVLGASL